MCRIFDFVLFWYHESQAWAFQMDSSSAITTTPIALPLVVAFQLKTSDAQLDEKSLESTGCAVLLGIRRATSSMYRIRALKELSQVLVPGDCIPASFDFSQIIGVFSSRRAERSYKTLESSGQQLLIHITRTQPARMLTHPCQPLLPKFS